MNQSVTRILAPSCAGSCKAPKTKMHELAFSAHVDPRQPWWWGQTIVLHDIEECPDAQRSIGMLRALEDGETPTEAELAAAQVYRVSLEYPTLHPSRRSH